MNEVKSNVEPFLNFWLYILLRIKWTDEQNRNQIAWAVLIFEIGFIENIWTYPTKPHLSSKVLISDKDSSIPISKDSFSAQFYKSTDGQTRDNRSGHVRISPEKYVEWTK